MAKIEIKTYSVLCELEKFRINGIEASEKDFGRHRDEGHSDDYGCANMKFRPIRCTQKVLDKYKINVDEYNEICDKLDEKLSWGCCSWCS